MLVIRRRTGAEIRALMRNHGPATTAEEEALHSGAHLHRRSCAPVSAITFALLNLEESAARLQAHHEEVEEVRAGRLPPPPRPIPPIPPGRRAPHAWAEAQEYHLGCAHQVVTHWLREHADEVSVLHAERLQADLEAYMYRTSTTRFQGVHIIK